MTANALFELKEGLFIALKAIKANKIRSVLATLGIIIGVWIVVLMSVALDGIDGVFRNGIGILGSENIYIHKWQWGGSDRPFWELRNRPHIVYEEYEEYARLAKVPESISPFVTLSKDVKYYQNLNPSTIIYGTNDKYMRTSNIEMGDGRFFTEVENRSGRNVAVVGSEIADNLFDGNLRLGAKIEIDGHEYKVIGFLKAQGSVMMGNFNPDKQVIIPINSLFKKFARKSTRGIVINAKAPSLESVEAMKGEAESLMRKIRGLTYRDENNFSINQQEAIQQSIDQVVSVINIGGYSITGLALLVGAIGIMNIMFVSVKERTKEIGVRKAIGAKKRAILGQFIFESSVICLIGGIIGLGFAIISSMAVNQFLPTEVSTSSFILAIVVSSLTGVISGIAPAYSAAKLDPVDALRYE